MTRLTIKEWANVLRNMEDEGDEVEVLWLDGTNEWVLCWDCELFEDGFESEEEAQARLDEVEKKVGGRLYE